MRILVFLFSLLVLTGCNEVNQDVEPQYFDLKGYFDGQAGKLSRANTLVTKTVGRNSVSETKLRAEVNWENELAHFSESDINKPAWESSYAVTENVEGLIYTARDSSLRTRTIRISKKPDGKLHSIRISNRTSNFLYQTDEDLIYYPDSLYEIRKKQRVIVLGSNSYVVTGKFR